MNLADSDIFMEADDMERHGRGGELQSSIDTYPDNNYKSDAICHMQIWLVVLIKILDDQWPPPPSHSTTLRGPSSGGCESKR